jgi:phosphatidate cytidylyltransferase
MAYVSGRLFGKHRIWPSLSPGKTWEGSIGGALFTLLLGWIFSRYYVELAAWEWMVFALIVVVFGSLGDFLESWVKRTAEVKDSGNILPGHGGILDRFDSFLFAVPAVTVYIYILG